MSIRTPSFVATVAAMACAVAGTALGAQSTVPLNIRSGPGTNYGIVDTLSPGVEVDIGECQGSWCYVVKPGPDGWASSRYLTDTNGFEPEPDEEEPDIGFSFDLDGFSFSFGVGEDFERLPIHRTGRVCFYEDWNYEGDRFCAEPGDTYRGLRVFNNRISSIRVIGGAEALVCEDPYFGGRCAIIDRSIRRLRDRNNDVISSVRVR